MPSNANLIPSLSLSSIFSSRASPGVLKTGFEQPVRRSGSTVGVGVGVSVGVPVGVGVSDGVGVSVGVGDGVSLTSGVGVSVGVGSPPGVGVGVSGGMGVGVSVAVGSGVAVSVAGAVGVSGVGVPGVGLGSVPCITGGTGRAKRPPVAGRLAEPEAEGQSGAGALPAPGRASSSSALVWKPRGSRPYTNDENAPFAPLRMHSSRPAVS